jgi:RNA polymerase sigma factor (sigma-70 family)
MEVSALKYSGGIGLHGRSPLLRLQSDERLVALVRRGNAAAFEMLVSRYESRLLSFCRHLLGCREDAEDVLQEVLAAAYNAMLGDDRPINVRPWLYRIARNRSLNHLRKIQALGVDSMDIHLSDHGATTADKVHEREEFRLLVGDIRELPETQRTALVLREMDALSYEQIAEAMETTVPSVKSLLVRARVSLAEAAEARLLSCEEVRIELAEVAEGLQRKPGPLVRRHLKACQRCRSFESQLKHTNKALAALFPLGPFLILRKLALTHLGHSAGSGAAGTTAAGTTAAGTAAAGSTIAVSSGAGSFISAGVGAIATKAAAGLAAAALVTAGAVEVDRTSHPRPTTAAAAVATPGASAQHIAAGVAASTAGSASLVAPVRLAPVKKAKAHAAKHKAGDTTATDPAATTPTATTTTPADATAPTTTVPAPGRTDTTTVPTVLPPSGAGATTTTTTTTVVPVTSSPATPAPTGTTTTPVPTTPTPTTSTPETTTTPTPTTTTPTPTPTTTTPDPAPTTGAPSDTPGVDPSAGTDPSAGPTPPADSATTPPAPDSTTPPPPAG